MERPVRLAKSIKRPLGIGGERRGARRYRLSLEMQWNVLQRRRSLDNGAGHTLDLSSSGVSFETERALQVGANIELSISWPARLHETVPMKLLISGRVVRSTGRVAAIRTKQYEFHTTAPAQSMNRNPRAGARALGSPISITESGRYRVN